MEIYKNVSFNKSNSSRGSPGKEVDLTRQNSILTADFFECWPCHIQRPITWEVFMSSHWNFQDKEQKKGYLRNYRICNEILFIFSAVELSLNFPIFLGVLELPRLTIQCLSLFIIYHFSFTFEIFKFQIINLESLLKLLKPKEVT